MSNDHSRYRRQTAFRSPVRRQTRQRSGYKVSGETTGGECKLKRAQVAHVDSRDLVMTFERAPVQLVPLFTQEVALVAFGGYVFPSTDVTIRASLEYIGDDETKEISHVDKNAAGNKWTKLGVHSILDMKKLKVPTGRLESTFILASDEVIGRVDFFGFDLNTVDYYEDRDLLNSFKQKTRIYLPEIYYFDLDEPFAVMPREYQKMQFSLGRCVVLKSCNRCARYLLIDIENERNVISFSNHCVSRAPCIHPSFSSYRIVENECERLPEYILERIAGSDAPQSTLQGDSYVASRIQTYYGYQLECRSCKKYYVNLPLNPMRDSTQHREDSLRRRALEVLVDQLLGREWIYHKTRLEKETEFDVHIWERFGRKCFNCGRKLQQPKDMALDHTMPLAMLWPLDETATCLCNTCNSQKRDKFPTDFYSEDKLVKLAEISGLSKECLHSRRVNMKVLKELKRRVVWFFDEFLMNPDYQKVRRGKRTSDLIYKAIQAAIEVGGVEMDLVREYRRRTQHRPKSISMDS